MVKAARGQERRFRGLEKIIGCRKLTTWDVVSYRTHPLLVFGSAPSHGSLAAKGLPAPF